MQTNVFIKRRHVLSYVYVESICVRCSHTQKKLLLATAAYIVY